MTTIRRPVALWIVVGLLMTPLLANYALQIYVRFWSSYRSQLEARHADWTLLDYVVRHYPGVLILIGCIGLVMLRRWAVHVFAILVVLRLREAVFRLLEDQQPDVPPIVLWLPLVMMIVPPSIGLLYSLYLARKGTLRKGFWRWA
jgi:hypothetical protein